MRRAKRRWLRVGVFLTCERVEGEASPGSGGPWTLHGVWHHYHLQNALSDLPGAAPYTPFTLFMKMVSRLKQASRPRELEAHLYHPVHQRLICRYRFQPMSFRPGTIVYTALPLLPPPVPEAAWYEFLVVLDDPGRTVLARAEVYLTP